MGQGKINRFDIVKILVHQDHYHIYDSNNREAITYTNPINLFPNAYFGEYGNKSHKQVAENNSSQVKPNDNKNLKLDLKLNLMRMLNLMIIQDLKLNLMIIKSLK